MNVTPFTSHFALSPLINEERRLAELRKVNPIFAREEAKVRASWEDPDGSQAHLRRRLKQQQQQELETAARKTDSMA